MHVEYFFIERLSVLGCATQWSAEFAIGNSVRLFLCLSVCLSRSRITLERFKISNYTSTIWRRNFSGFLRPNFAILNLTVHPSQCARKRRPLLTATVRRIIRHIPKTAQVRSRVTIVHTQEVAHGVSTGINIADLERPWTTLRPLIWSFHHFAFELLLFQN